MTTRVLKPGGEVDAWCTKCRMDLLHRIIAMHSGKIVRVECRTCGGHHNYHRPKNAPPEPKVAISRPKASSAPSSSARAAGRTGPRKIYADEVERDRLQAWEKTVAGQPITSFKPYRATAVFEAGELIRHAKFGDGYIVRVIDRQKVEVMFKDGSRTLAQALDS